MDVSIVIPVWNESKKIESDLDAAIHFFEIHNLEGEVILSDDGSTDDTLEVIRSFLSEKMLPVRIIKNDHLGKGHAVRSGILQAKGDIILFIDSGNCIPYSDVWNGIQLIRRGDCEIAQASRFLPGSRILIPKGWIRKTLSFLFRKLVHRYMKIPGHLTDTQCGLKIYKKDLGQSLYQLCFTRGFMFDIEIILRAIHENILICEFPVRWSSDQDTRLYLFRSIPEIWKELRRIERELK
jgi:dolichyl-phosphate beta-glucosyltransferase